MKLQELMAQELAELPDIHGKWAIDRDNPPPFFVIQDSIRETDTWKREAGKVVADSDDHCSASEGWHTVGHVSKQTPFGQGTGLGIQIEHLRPATREEVLTALKEDHPHGEDFRPLSHYPHYLRNGYLKPAGSTPNSREQLAKEIERKLEIWMDTAKKQIFTLEKEE